MPLIYNGDEVGAAFEPYDEGPPIAWEDEHGLIPHYTRLAELRLSVPALRSRELELVPTDQDDAVLAYLRPGAAPKGTVLVVLNFSAQPLRVHVLDPNAIAPMLAAGRATDLITGTEIRIAPRNTALDLPAFATLLLKPATAD